MVTEEQMVSKWSFNMSTWCTRLVHVSITIGICLVLLINNTVLRQQLNVGLVILPITYILVTFLSIVLYFFVACMDPGFVKKGDADVVEIKLIVDEDDENDDISLYESGHLAANGLDVEMRNNVEENIGEKTKMLNSESVPTRCFNLEPHQRCGLCGLQRPIRARHCRDCKRCVRKFDHHCPWITNCIGERNHRWFWTFLFYETMLITWSIYISVTGYESSKEDWVSRNIFLVLSDIVMGILLLVVVSLFCIHTYMLVNNHTTWETISRHRISYLKEMESSRNPFDLGICRNIATFFCYFKPYDWTVVYKRSKNTSHLSNAKGQQVSDSMSEIYYTSET